MKTKHTFQTITKSAFKKLSKYTQRVLLAQDVLAQIAAAKYRPRRGQYIGLTLSKKDLEKLPIGQKQRCINVGAVGGNIDIFELPLELSIKDAIDVADKCHVCAKGSLICSYIGKFNRYNAQGLRYKESEFKEAVNIFGHNIWSELEAQFEGTVSFRAHAVRDLLIRNHRNLEIPKPQTLTALMKNIIENNGRLKVRGILIE